MTPEQYQQFEQMKATITELENKVKSLTLAATIPFDVEQAFRQRLEIATFTPISASIKSATSENQSVNEAGVASYSVLKAPDAFIQITIANQVNYIPIYT